MIKKTLRWAALALIGLILIGIGVGWALNEIRPEGEPGPAADQLARRMENVLGGDAWEETGVVSWTFRSNRHHLWDRERHVCRVEWDEYEVLVHINSRTGIAFQNGMQVEGKEGEELVIEAWKMWVNDAFWLTAPFKAFDPGVERSLVMNKDGDSTLLVSYATGGSTPGDAYLWHFDEDGRPDNWKMWVSIIPVGGLKVPFDGWLKTETGVILPVKHSGWISMELTNVHTAFSLDDWFSAEQDPFALLEAGEL